MVSARMTPVRNDLTTSAPVARRARCAGKVTCSARRICRGERFMANMTSEISSTRDRKNSKRASGGGRLPDWRAMPRRNALSEKRANVSSKISRTITSKSSRVSFRRSGSVVISKRCAPSPGITSVTSTEPAWNPGVHRQRATRSCLERKASAGVSSMSRSVPSASSTSRNSNRYDKDSRIEPAGIASRKGQTCHDGPPASCWT